MSRKNLPVFWLEPTGDTVTRSGVTDDGHPYSGEVPLYRRTDTGEVLTLKQAGVGAMWDADWMPDVFKGPDGICLVVQTPGGTWMVDNEASNCTRPQRAPSGNGATRFERTHYCWVRHGDPRDPQGLKTGQPLHVDKNGDTCAAGAGSIVCGSYHGFLHNGFLTDCP